MSIIFKNLYLILTFLYACIAYNVVVADTHIHQKEQNKISTNGVKQCDVARYYNAGYYTITINGSAHTDAQLILVRKSDSVVFVNVKVLKELNIEVPNTDYLNCYGINFLPMTLFKNAKWRLDSDSYTLILDVPIQYFSNNLIEAKDLGYHKHAVPKATGGYLNYYIYSYKMDNSKINNNGNFGLNFFTADINANTQFYATEGIKNQLIRTTTTFERPDPNAMTVMRFGDIISNGGSWGGNVNMGGFQYGSDTSLQPSFITTSLSSVKGAAVMPSTAQLYINNSLMLQKDLDTGPFSINQIPLANGKGDVKLVITDMLGRKQIIQQPYYVGSNMLRSGLSEYSYGVGFIRNNLGIKSNDYSKLALYGTSRRGIKDNLQFKGHIESAGRTQAAIGMGYDWLLDHIGTVGLDVAASEHKKIGFGKLISMSYIYQYQNLINFGMNDKLATSNFSTIGMSTNQYYPSNVSQVYLGVPIARGNFNLMYTAQAMKNQPRYKIISANYGNSTIMGIFASLGYLTNIGNSPKNKYLSLMLSKSFGDGISAQAGMDGSSGNWQKNLRYDQSSTSKNSYDYTIQAYGQNFANKNFNIDTQIGTYGIQAYNYKGVNSYSINASGSFVYMDRSLYWGMPISESFCIADTDHFANVPVYENNRYIGKTNKSGKIMIHDVPSYSDTKISIGTNTNALPINAHVDVDQLTINPYANSGVVADFNIKSAHSVIFYLKLKDGRYVQEGSEVILNNNYNDSTIVADNGQVYFENIKKAHNEVTVVINNKQSCHFNFDINNIQNVQTGIIDYGTMLCS